MRLDLLLVNPGNRSQVYQSLGARLSAVEPPVWAGLIATFARARGFSVGILDANAEGLAAAQAAERILATNPRLTAVVVYGHQPSASTQNMPAAGAVCAAIKTIAPDAKVLLLGGHVASLPGRTLAEEQADFVSASEGLHTVVALLHALNCPTPDYRSVPGLWYRSDGEMRSNPAGPLVTDLDHEMPGIAWDLLPMDRYRAHNWHCFGGLPREPYAALYTTLGCPYHCAFCCIQAPFKAGEAALGYKPGVNSYRFWSPEAVLAQIDTLVSDHGVKNIKIADEMFVLNPRHVTRLCDLLIERNYDLNIWAYARVDSVREALVDKLRRAGVTWLAFGIEAASDRVRGDVQKGFGQKLIFDTLARVRQAGINVVANYIFGLPEDDLASMQETLDLALELNTEFANFYCTMAYPGSQIHKVACEQGWPLPNTWSGYSQHAWDSRPLPTRYVSAADVLRFRDEAFTTYFSSPRYLDMIAARFGPTTAEEIREMASHTLERELYLGSTTGR
jgi:radical SAM superfamily enzyme YgiQ (UPF0313 family)